MATTTPQTCPLATPTGLFALDGADGENHTPIPGVVVAWQPVGIIGDDRSSLGREVVVGRSSSADWCIRDKLLSRRHFELSPLSSGRFLVKDLESKNGTFLDGRAVDSARELGAGSIIQAGSCVFVVCDDLWKLASPGEKAHERLTGRFHAMPLIRRLRVAARTERHVLLEGESGCGKELAAEVLHEVLVELGRSGPFVALNAACFAGEDDAVASLLGVSERAFTGVGGRIGALAEADGGTLFLDEVHNLPPRAQRALLRFSEDGLLRQLGVEAKPRELDVRLILGTNNLPVEQACADGVLAADLVTRLHRVPVPALRERRADVPSVFLNVLRRALSPDSYDDVVKCLDPLKIERLCIHDYALGNVRELEDLAAVVRARILENEMAPVALATAFDEAFGPSNRQRPDAGPDGSSRASNYEQHRQEIIDTYMTVGDNLSQLEARLRERGIKVNRRWLATYLDRWGVRQTRKRQ